MPDKTLTLSAPTNEDVARARSLIDSALAGSPFQNAGPAPSILGRANVLTFEIRYGGTEVGEGYCSLLIPDDKSEVYLDAVDTLLSSGEDYSDAARFLAQDGAVFASGETPARSMIALEAILGEKSVRA